MKQLTTSAGVFGPFKNIETFDDCYYCDGCYFPFGVVGMGTIGPYVEPLPNPAVLAASKTKLTAQIDADVDAIYESVIGNRATEYTQANADALAYKTAAYTGTVPSSVQSWATAKGWTTTQAADDILAAAVRLANLRDAIRAKRLLRKEAARVAVDKAGIDSAASQWATDLAAIRAAAGL